MVFERLIMKLAVKPIFACFLLFSMHNLFAQESGISVSKPSSFDSTYIESYDDWLVLRLYGIVKDFSFGLNTAYLSEEAELSPNQNLNVGFGFNYKWLGINFGFNFPFINNDDDIYGKTRRMDGQMNLYGRKFIFDGHFQLYKGLYLENPSSFVDYEPSPKIYPQMPGHKVITLGGSFYYLFNYRKFSSRAVFTNNERQKKSAGSWMLGGFLENIFVKSDSLILPPVNGEEILKEEDNFRSAYIINLGIKGGYIHTFVIFNNYYFTISVKPGLGIGHTRFKFPDDHAKVQYTPFASVSSRLAIGYSSRKYFWGFYAVNESYSFAREELVVNYGLGHLRFFFGVRISGFKNTKAASLLPF